MLSKITIIYLTCLIISTFYIIVRSELVLVDTELGKVAGVKWKSTSGRTFNAFMNIPYGENPTGNLRFKAPIPAKPWKGVLNATVDGSRCVQKDGNTGLVVGSEDCLNLNVFTPKLPTNGSRPNLPVMVYHFGGRFKYGGADTVELGPHKLMNKDVILVDFNHRLGALGYLSTADSFMPGNYAVLDSILVLKWIQKYIKYFGGDSASVTVTGHSSGGRDAAYHLFSPLSKGLFHRAIIMSSFPVAGYYEKYANPAQPRSLAQKLDCPIGNSSVIVDCLRNVDARKLIVETEFDNFNFAPVIDGIVFEEDFLLTAKKGKLNKADVLMGTTRDEGALYYCYIQVVFKQTLKEFKKGFKFLMGTHYSYEKLKRFGELIQKDYFGKINVSDPVEFLQAAIRAYGDIFVVSDGDRFTKLLLDNGANVYTYKLLFESDFSFYNIPYLGCYHKMGIGHSDDLQYIWRSSTYENPGKKTEEELKISEIYLNMIANFVTTGDPSKGSPNSTLPYKFTPTTKENYEYFAIDERPTMRHGLMSTKSPDYINIIGTTFF